MHGGSPPPSPDGHSGGGGAASATPSGDGQGLLSKIATRLKLDEEKVREAYSVADGELRIGVVASRLAATKAEGTKELALIVAAGRQGAGLEEWTSQEVIRDTCKYYGKYDEANFASHLKALDADFQSHGSGKKREFQLRAPAWEKARLLVERLATPS